MLRDVAVAMAASDPGRVTAIANSIASEKARVLVKIANVLLQSHQYPSREVAN